MIRGKIKHLLKETGVNLLSLLPAERLNLFQCSENGFWNQYFIEADSHMEYQWGKIIWPLIQDFDFDSVLELAPGAGRNTEKLCEVAKKIHAVDLNLYALEKCRSRLGPSLHGCEINYYLNDGKRFPMIKSTTVSTIYCWDAAVHFDKRVLANYVKEFKRVLKSGGRGFIHHSNLGNKADKNILKNQGMRSNMSKQLFWEMCRANNLKVVHQVDQPWDNYMDCITIFENSSESN